jgi:hypothetical protein
MNIGSSYAKKKKWDDAADAFHRASQNFKLGMLPLTISSIDDG